MGKGKQAAEKGKKGKEAAITDPDEEGAAAEEAEETAEEETAEDAEEEAADDEPDHKAEAERLRKENEELRRERSERRAAAPASTAKVTTATLDNMTPKERELLEEQTGLSYEQIYAKVSAHEQRTGQLATAARLNVAEALEDMVLQDAGTSRLKPHIREYLNDLTVEDRADPERLAKHMAKAKVYAKGKLAEKSGGRASTDKTKQRQERSPDEGGAGDEEDGEEGVAEAGKTYEDGGFKVRVSELGGRAGKNPKAHRHPRDPNGVIFKSTGPNALDKAPVFGSRD